MRDRFNAFKQELSPSPAFLQRVEKQMNLNLKKARRSRAAHSRRTALACAAALLIALLVAFWRFPRSAPDLQAPAPLVSSTETVKPEATAVPPDSLSASTLDMRTLMRGSYLVGYPSDETIPVCASAESGSEVIATLVSGDFALIGDGSLESRDAAVWPIQWWDANEGCMRSGWIDNQDVAIKSGSLLLSPVKYIEVVGTVLDGGAAIHAGHDLDSPELRTLQAGQSIYLIASYGEWILASTAPFAQSEADPATVGWLPMSSVGDAEGNPFAIPN